MKKIIEYFLLILLIFSTLLLSACRDDSQEEWYIDTTNEIIEACTGKCLTREELLTVITYTGILCCILNIKAIEIMEEV